MGAVGVGVLLSQLAGLFGNGWLCSLTAAAERLGELGGDSLLRKVLAPAIEQPCVEDGDVDPSPVWETPRALERGETVAFMASWSQVLKPPVKSLTVTRSVGGGMNTCWSIAAALDERQCANVAPAARPSLPW